MYPTAGLFAFPAGLGKPVWVTVEAVKVPEPAGVGKVLLLKFQVAIGTLTHRLASVMTAMRQAVSRRGCRAALLRLG